MYIAGFYFDSIIKQILSLCLNRYQHVRFCKYRFDLLTHFIFTCTNMCSIIEQKKVSDRTKKVSDRTNIFSESNIKMCILTVQKICSIPIGRYQDEYWYRPMGIELIFVTLPYIYTFDSDIYMFDSQIYMFDSQNILVRFATFFCSIIERIYLHGKIIWFDISN